MSDPVVLGYWFRFGASGTALHVARWTKTPAGGLLVESSCRALVKSPTEPEVPQHLVIQPTPVDALRIMDENQARHLCRKCRARYARKP